MATSATKYEKLEEVEDVETSTSAERKSKLNIALVGETESGKSSFINAFLRLEHDDHNAAKIGFDKSNEVERYILNSDVTLVDHPGLDTTSTIPDPETYFRVNGLERFDGFLLFIKGRYNKYDEELAEELSLAGKPFLLVRTKIDNDIPERIRGSEKEQEILGKMRENVLKLLQGLNYDEETNREKIFLISNVYPDNEIWDFSLLKNKILTLFQQCLPFTGPSTEAVSSELRTELLSFPELQGCQDLEEVDEKIWKKLEEAKYMEIHLAIIGRSGVGKSSFINALRGIPLGHKNEAPTGPIEVTKEPTPYHFPNNKRIALWDLPGVGATMYPDVETYCNEIDLKKFDEFLIFETERFSEANKKLAKKIRDLKKPFFFVRSKIDSECRNESKTKNNFDEEKMLKKMKSDIAEKLDDLLPEQEDSIFLISSHYPKKWEFGALVAAITEKLSEAKKSTFVFSTDFFSPANVEAKVKKLKGDIWKFAIKSVAKKVAPKRFCSKSSREYNLETINEKVDEYLEQLKIPTKENPDEYGKLSRYLKKRVERFYVTKNLLCESYKEIFESSKGETELKSSNSEEDLGLAKDYPWLFRGDRKGDIINISYSLKCLLKEMKALCLTIYFQNKEES